MGSTKVTCKLCKSGLMYCRNIKTLHSTHVYKCPKRVGLKTCSYRLRCLEAAICCKLQVYLKYLILWLRQVIQVHVFQLFAPVWAACTVGINVVIRGKCYTFILPPWEYVFALIHIVCVLVCAHTHTHCIMVKRLVFHMVHSIKQSVLLELTAYGKSV